MNSPPLEVRLATPVDADAARRLLAVRDSLEGTTSAESRGPDIENEQRRLWLAFSGDRAVGMSSVLIRDLSMGSTTSRAAYWTGLFVDPSYGSFFAYPRLLLAMFSGLRDAGIREVYAAVRRQQVAESHLRIGFEKLGDMSVLAKPIRPFLLLAKHRRLLGHSGPVRMAMRAGCALLDAFPHLLIRLQNIRGWRSANTTPWSATILTELADLYHRSGVGQVCQPWTAESLGLRYAGNNGRYILFPVRQRDQLEAVAILRVIDRPDGIRAAVIMDLIGPPSAKRELSRALAAIELSALSAGCDVVLVLDRLPQSTLTLLRRRTYLKSNERYSLLIKSDNRIPKDALPKSLTDWRFSFGDHDTF